MLGFVAVLLCHDTNLIRKLTGRRLPVNQDPLHRVRGWSDVARVGRRGPAGVLLAEGKPVFIIGDHYGLVGEISFYLPEAKATVTSDPLVFYRTDSRAVNQFYFWPGYEDRKGQNAIFVRELDRDQPKPSPVPREVEQQFESVTELGVTQRALSSPRAVAAPDLRLPRLAVNRLGNHPNLRRCATTIWPPRSPAARHSAGNSTTAGGPA